LIGREKSAASPPIADKASKPLGALFFDVAVQASLNCLGVYNSLRKK
jgi:hypothetical protein